MAVYLYKFYRASSDVETAGRTFWLQLVTKSQPLWFSMAFFFLFTDRLHPIKEGNSIPLEVNVIKDNQQEIKNPQPNHVQNHQDSDYVSHSSMHSQATQNTNLSQSSKIDHRYQPTADRRQYRISRSNSRSSDVNSGYITATNVHNAPRVYRKINDDMNPLSKRERRHRTNSLPHTSSWKQNGYVIPASRIENLPLKRSSLDSLQAHGHGNSRTAYEFMEAARQQQRLDRHVAIGGIEIDEPDGSSEKGIDIDETSWIPTGIFAVFIVTLWTAVLKLIDSIDNNGPVKCSEGEEVRLWICSGCLSLIFFLGEIIWKGKNFSKALFGAILVFSYMMLGHAEPLTCRLGEEKLNEINKWQAAMNFFFAALMFTMVYQEIANVIRQRRKRRKKKRKDDDSSDDDESVMRVYRV